MGKRKELPPELSFLTAEDTDKFITEKITLKRSFDYRRIHLEGGTEMVAVKSVKIDDNKTFELKSLSCPEWFTLCKMFKIPNASRMRIEHMRVCIANAIINGDHAVDTTGDNSSNKKGARRQLPLHQQDTVTVTEDTTTTDNGREDSSTPAGSLHGDDSADKGEASASKESASTAKNTNSKPKSSETIDTATSAILSHGNKSKEAVALAISRAASLASKASSNLAESTLAMLAEGTKPPVDIVARLAQAETDLVNATAAVAAARARAIATTHLMAMEDESDGRPRKKPRHST